MKVLYANIFAVSTDSQQMRDKGATIANFASIKIKEK